MASKADLRAAQIAIAADHPIRAAIAEVRSDSTPTSWCLAKLNDAMSNVEMVGSGTGGVAELAAKLTSDNAYYVRHCSLELRPSATLLGT